MFPIFLIGGGWEPDGFGSTYGAFLETTLSRGRRKIALILAADNDADQAQTANRYRAVFEALGVGSEALEVFWGSATARIPIQSLAACQPTGVFVGGGPTPLYHSLLCADRNWLDYLRQSRVPYAGFSAGAAIAARQAIVGGWKVSRDNREIAVLDAEFGEDLEAVEVRPGLGLIPFAVEVHASQWGTPTRLMQAVDLGWVAEGWAIDENTVLCVRAGHLEVCGLGQVYHVRRLAADTLAVRLYRAGAAIPIRAAQGWGG